MTAPSKKENIREQKQDKSYSESKQGGKPLASSLTVISAQMTSLLQNQLKESLLVSDQVHFLSLSVHIYNS